MRDAHKSRLRTVIRQAGASITCVSFTTEGLPGINVGIRAWIPLRDVLRDGKLRSILAPAPFGLVPRVRVVDGIVTVCIPRGRGEEVWVRRLIRRVVLAVGCGIRGLLVLPLIHGVVHRIHGPARVLNLAARRGESCSSLDASSKDVGLAVGRRRC